MVGGGRPSVVVGGGGLNYRKAGSEIELCLVLLEFNEVETDCYSRF